MDIRILSFNIHKGVGWINRKSTLDQIHVQIQALHPDIILLQEICGYQFDLFANGRWPHFTYGKNAIYPKGHHGNAILSKFPILFTENIDLSTNHYEHRGLLHAVIYLAEKNAFMHLLCVHLGLFKSDRKKQLEKIAHFIIENIPDHEPLILGGDFNDWSGIATDPLVNKLSLQEAFLSSAGSYAKTFPAWAPVLKLDRIYHRGFDTYQAYRIIHKPWKILSDHIALEAFLKLK
ncbi:MAG: endonuclease/exonuclease/phosphatase family protein [Gammaproteobacteria bacterium]|nr:endonuclease/exonuclease/phosphatase family protein [Gammaproteobacteria bacterium]